MTSQINANAILPALTADQKARVCRLHKSGSANSQIAGALDVPKVLIDMYLRFDAPSRTDYQPPVDPDADQINRLYDLAHALCPPGLTPSLAILGPSLPADPAAALAYTPADFKGPLVTRRRKCRFVAALARHITKLGAASASQIPIRNFYTWAAADPAFLTAAAEAVEAGLDWLEALVVAMSRGELEPIINQKTGQPIITETGSMLVRRVVDLKTVYRILAAYRPQWRDSRAPALSITQQQVSSNMTLAAVPSAQEARQARDLAEARLARVAKLAQVGAERLQLPAPTAEPERGARAQ